MTRSLLSRTDVSAWDSLHRRLHATRMMEGIEHRGCGQGPVRRPASFEPRLSWLPPARCRG
ncbi:MAG TPA: hypothetical protein DD781_21420 [Leclercia adecarboxylata]|nr:hypothetical protein [Leclercia adecarboxylata]